MTSRRGCLDYRGARYVVRQSLAVVDDYDREHGIYGLGVENNKLLMQPVHGHARVLPLRMFELWARWNQL